MVNLGSGTNIVPGWINIDDFAVPNETKDFLRGNALNIPLKENSVDYILMDQVLEHIAMADVVSVMYEIKRVLKKGGRCVIIVPDFEDAINQWMSIKHNAFFNPLVYQYLSEVVYGNQMHAGEFHKTPMCAGYLNYVCNTVGLVDKEILFYPANGEVPQFPGVRFSPPEARCRNAQLVVDLRKS